MEKQIKLVNAKNGDPNQPLRDLINGFSELREMEAEYIKSIVAGGKNGK